MPLKSPIAILHNTTEFLSNNLAAGGYIVVFENEEVVRALSPDLSKLQQLPLRGGVVTNPRATVDFLRKKKGGPENPVTGSAHCELEPYWASRLEKNTREARPVSKRGGNLRCRVQGNRVILSGSTVTFMVADIYL